MIELAHTLLPNLPDDLIWVYGIMYIVEMLFFFGLLFAPFYMIFSLPRRRHYR